MKTFLQSILIGATVLAASTAMADVTFYAAENFAGQPFETHGAVPNFVARGFNDRARSAVVEAPVEVCVDINYGGGCTVLNPGRYPTLGNLSGLISSVRPTGVARSVPAAAVATFYQGENFAGESFSARGAISSFAERGFDNHARSVVVEGGPMEVCIDVNYGGGCTVLKPGRYPTLGNLGNHISSVRPVAGATPRAVTGSDQRGRGARATLYGRPDMSGRSVTLGDEGSSDLQNFNERASSLVVERGYWIFCTEPQFRGECRTFGPGEYRQLPPDFDEAISSGRRISNNYPYANRPNWENR